MLQSNASAVSGSARAAPTASDIAPVVPGDLGTAPAIRSAMAWPASAIAPPVAGQLGLSGGDDAVGDAYQPCSSNEIFSF